MTSTWLTALIAAGIVINAFSLLVALHRLGRLQRPRSERRAVATLILPLTGRAAGLDRIMASLEAQTLAPRRLIISVESAADPAHVRATSYVGRASFPVEIVVAGPASDQAQKCRNQIAALTLVDEADEAIVFLDGDILPTPWWLSALVSPLVDGHSDLVTGHRWQMPVEPRLGAHLVTAIDRAVTLMPRLDAGFAHVVWGGSLAVSREAASTMNLAASLERTLSDDLSLAERASAAGLRILTRGALLVPSPSSLGLVAAWHFARRQYQIGRIYRPWLWWLAAAVILLRLAIWLVVLGALASGGDVGLLAMTMAALAVAKPYAVGEVGAKLGLPDPAEVRFVQLALGLAQPLVDVFHASVILAAAATRQVTWGHVVYSVGGPYDIRVKERKPFHA
ncbi:MAG: glycosyltransferase [Hyphomicrobium sp.]